MALVENKFNPNSALEGIGGNVISPEKFNTDDDDQPLPSQKHQLCHRISSLSIESQNSVPFPSSDEKFAVAETDEKSLLLPARRQSHIMENGAMGQQRGRADSFDSLNGSLSASERFAAVECDQPLKVPNLRASILVNKNESTKSLSLPEIMQEVGKFDFANDDNHASASEKFAHAEGNQSLHVPVRRSSHSFHSDGSSQLTPDSLFSVNSPFNASAKFGVSNCDGLPPVPIARRPSIQSRARSRISLMDDSFRSQSLPHINEDCGDEDGDNIQSSIREAMRKLSVVEGDDDESLPSALQVNGFEPMSEATLLQELGMSVKFAMAEFEEAIPIPTRQPSFGIEAFDNSTSIGFDSVPSNLTRPAWKGSVEDSGISGITGISDDDTYSLDSSLVSGLTGYY